MEIHHVTKRSPRLPILPYSHPLATHDRIPGSIDWATRVSDYEFLIRGWMLHPVTELSSIQVYINGNHVGSARFAQRQDLEANMKWVRHAGHAGFEIRLSPAQFSNSGINHLDFVGHRPRRRMERRLAAVARLFRGAVAPNDFGIPVGRYHTLCRPDLNQVAPSPPSHLMDRVAGHHDLIGFKTGGIKLYGDFLEAMARHRNPSTVGRILDWGCGCGRSTVHFLLHHPASPEVYGCDIDGETIAWCKENLQPGQFTAIAPMPPLPYPDNHFDAIVSCSVFSHLKRDLQHIWLAELKRVLAPRGLLLASFHGKFAASVAHPPQRAALVDERGIIDDTPDDALGDIVEAGYYNSTFQTREYTLREWSKHLKIVDYIVAGMHNYQDLAVLQKHS
jgi:ubiquinone/menaquinone biosynthesis C-methylase UbiE